MSRASPQASPAPTAVPATARLRTVQEICAGRNVISKAICETRECGAQEHASEPLCQQVRANEERRRAQMN